MTSKKEKARQAKRRAGRVMLDLTPELKQELSDIAAHYGVTMSQIAVVVMTCGFEPLREGKIDLSKYIRRSRNPFRDNNLDVEEFLEDWENIRRGL